MLHMAQKLVPGEVQMKAMTMMYFFLVRGDEDRIYDSHTWGDEEWEEWNTKMEADYDTKQRILDESKKRRERNAKECDMKSTVVLGEEKKYLIRNPPNFMDPLGKNYKRHEYSFFPHHTIFIV